MTREHLCVLFDVLPMEPAYMDVSENVRFWNRTEGRSSAWQLSAPGKPVQECRRAVTVPVAEAVREELKSGRGDVVE